MTEIPSGNGPAGPGGGDGPGDAGSGGGGPTPAAPISPLTGRPETVRPPVAVMPSSASPVPPRRSWTKRLLVGAGIVGAVALGVWGAWRGLIALATWGVMQAPTDWDVSLGELASKEIEGRVHVCGDEDVQAFADAMRDALVAEVDSNPFEFEFKVVEDDIVNAFALPGGFVYIHTGLLEKAEDSAEVAGVLGHEINHALLRHGMKRIARTLAVGIVVNLFLGGAGLDGQMAGLAANLGELSFGRDEETEADVEGLPIVADAGFEPEGMIRFFKKLGEDDTRDEKAKALMRYVSTHPLTEDRIADIREIIEKEDIEPDEKHTDRVKELDAHLERIKGRCGDRPDRDDEDDKGRGDGDEGRKRGSDEGDEGSKRDGRGDRDESDERPARGRAEEE